MKFFTFLSKNNNLFYYSIKHITVRSLNTRPRRAVLYVPGNDDKKIAKSLNLKVDCVALDCEDGVAISRKSEAREKIHSVLSKEPLSGDFGPELTVRVNSVRSGLCDDDLQSVLSSKFLPSLIWLPKVESSDELQWFSERLWHYMMKRGEADKEKIVSLGMLIESAKAIMTLQELCLTVQQISTMAPLKPEALIFGSDDLLADLGAQRSGGASVLTYARQKMVLIAKAFHLQAIDLVNIDYGNLSVLKSEAEEGAAMGYTGKQVIHPNQVPVVQDAFKPRKETVEWAKALIVAFNEHQTKGQGAFTFRGKMIDMPLLRQAQNILELAER